MGVASGLPKSSNPARWARARYVFQADTTRIWRSRPWLVPTMLVAVATCLMGSLSTAPTPAAADPMTPAITSISPDSGPSAGGTPVTITGTGLTGAVEVAFGGAGAMTFTVVSDTEITATAPPGTAGSVVVTVTTADGTSAQSPSDSFTYVPAPSVVSVSPSIGPSGTVVSILGAGFTGTTAVDFGGIPSTEFTVVSDTQISVTAPPQPLYAQHEQMGVSVTTVGGTAYGTFIYGPTWDQVTNDPTSPDESGAAMAYDAATGQLVLFGGYDGDFLNDTWTWNGTTWTQLSSDMSPPAREGATMAYDAATGQLVLFGGYDGEFLNDTWTWNGTNWSQQFPATSPSPRFATMAYDSTSDQLILFGGTNQVTQGGFLDDTWLWNGTGWTQLDPGTSPSARFVTAMADDPATGQLVLFGGSSTTGFLNDTWAWDGTTWTVYGGMEQAQDWDSSLTYDPRIGQLVLAEGGTPSGSNPSGTFSAWTLQSLDSVWTGVPTPRPGPEYATLMTYDPSTDQVVLLDGTNSTWLFVSAIGLSVTSISPQYGPASGGGISTISGDDFNNVTSLSVGGTNDPNFTVDSPTTITATLPPGPAGLVDVKLTTSTGGVADAGDGSYIYVGEPTISSISPNLGSTAGGTDVTIDGTNLDDGFPIVVTIGGMPARIDSFNGTSVSVTTPPGQVGSADVVVTTAGGTATDPGGFSYLNAPTVTSLSPSSGPTIGGTVVTITGAGFTGATAVGFGPNAASAYTVNSDTSITATVPAGSGTVDTTVTTEVTSATSPADQFTYVAAPTVLGVGPSNGSTACETSVLISGTNFSLASAVDFGNTPAASFTVDSATEITASAPLGLAGTVDITVTTGGGTSATSPADRFTYLSGPQVLSISPYLGPTAGGTVVTITGTCFTGATAVTFGMNSATSFTVNSPTSITATAPAGSGTVDTTVATASGTSATSPADQYTYVPPPVITSVTPSEGPSEGGTEVTIAGSNLLYPASVMVGPNRASVTGGTASQIVILTPSGTVGPADLVVTTLDGTATDAGGFTYLPPSTVTSVSPSSGPVSGGTEVTITGSGFTGATAVDFDVNPAAFTVLSATQIIATTPGWLAGTTYVQVVTPGGYADAPFTYVVSACDPAMITSTDSATALGGSPFSFTVTTTCNTSAAKFRAEGLPTGLRLVSNDNGTATIEGIPSTKDAGLYSVDILTSLPGGSGGSAVAFQTFSLTVDNAPIFKSKPRYLTHTGTAFSYPITTDYGYPFPKITTTPALPAGVNLVDNGNGTAALTGTPGPLAGGVYPLTITATNGVGPPVSQAFTLTVYQVPAVAPIADAVGTNRTAITPIPVSDTGYPVPTLKASGLPPGVTLSYTGTSGSIAGTPAKSGTYNAKVTAASKAGTSVQTFTLTVN